MYFNGIEINSLITQGRFKQGFSLYPKKHFQNKTTSRDNILPQITRAMSINAEKIVKKKNLAHFFMRG